MKFGLGMPGTHLFPPGAHPWEATASPEELVRIAQRADELGYDWLSVPEHILMVKENVEVMGSRWSHAFTAIAFIAGATKRIRVTNGVLVLPWHNCLEMAKMVSTLDFLSGGRVTLGFGVGNAVREFKLLNVDYHQRGAIADEYVDAMIELWTSDDPTFNGKFVQFDNVVFDPKPVQKPYPPLWVGGNTKAALRRAGRIGDGWNPSAISREKFPEMLEYLHEQPGFGARTRPFDIVMSLSGSTVEVGTHRQTAGASLDSRDAILEQVGIIEKMGATATNAHLGGKTSSVDQYLERLQWFAEEVLPAAR